MKLKFYIQIVFLFATYLVEAQQDAQYTQYMYNTLQFNPAYAGSRGAMSVFGLHRTQWVGMDDAPTTTNFSIHSPLKDSPLSMGVSILADRIGPINEQLISYDLSYTIRLQEEWRFSFGLRASTQLMSIQTNRLNPQQANDPLLQNISNDFSPNIGAGFYIRNNKFYGGLSLPFMLERTRAISQEEVVVREEVRSFYAMSGYVFDISPSLQFKPALLSKIEFGAPLQVDVSANFMWWNTFTIGTAYRWDAAFSVLTAYQINERWMIGYAYDVETTPLRNHNSGSHELFLRFELFDREGKIIAPRFF